MTATLSPVELGPQNPSDIRHFPSHTFPANLLHTIGVSNSLPACPIEHIDGIAKIGTLETEYRISLRADGIGGLATGVVVKGGLGTTKEVYYPLADEMAAYGRVVVVADTALKDVRKDKDRKDKSSTSVQIDSILSVVDAVQIPEFAKTFHLWGHSWGGDIVAGAAARAPELVESVILFETLFGCNRSALIGRTPSYIGRNLLPTLARLVTQGDLNLARQFASKSVRGMGELARQLWEVPGEHVEPYAKQLELAEKPYSVTSGDIDTFLPTREQIVAMNRATFSEIIHGGHNYPVDRPKRTAAITMHHIERIEQRG